MTYQYEIKDEAGAIRGSGTTEEATFANADNLLITAVPAGTKYLYTQEISHRRLSFMGSFIGPVGLFADPVDGDLDDDIEYTYYLTFTPVEEF